MDDGMTDDGADKTQALTELRDRIDTIDAEMHRLLMERGTVIDALIEAKGTSQGGAAYRPAREADMMRRMLARHTGRMPRTTVEHIWREIITNFTNLQAPFDVTADVSSDAGAMRDLVRFMFGFSVAMVPVEGVEAVIARVAASGGIGVIPQSTTGRWWRSMTPPDAPKLMAVLPFIRIPDRPADLPAFVLAPPLADPSEPELRIYAVRGDAPPARDTDTAVLATVSAGREGHDSLLADAGARSIATLTAAWRATDIVPVGGMAIPIDANGARLPLTAICEPDAS